MKQKDFVLFRAALCILSLVLFLGVIPTTASADDAPNLNGALTQASPDVSDLIYANVSNSLKRTDQKLTSLSMGQSESAVIMADGSLWMWGRNVHGELGDGTFNSRSEPVKVFDSGVESVSLGSGHSAAVMDDGSLWLWGWNLHGQVGNGTTDDCNRPVRVIDSGVRSVS